MSFAFFIGPFILVTTSAALATGISHARHPFERKLATLRLLSLTSIFAIVSAAAGGTVNTLRQIAESSADTNLEAMTRIAAGGFAESVAAPMVGFALLAVAWLAATFGVRKQL